MMSIRQKILLSLLLPFTVTAYDSLATETTETEEVIVYGEEDPFDFDEEFDTDYLFPDEDEYDYDPDDYDYDYDDGPEDTNDPEDCDD